MTPFYTLRVDDSEEDLECFTDLNEAIEALETYPWGGAQILEHVWDGTCYRGGVAVWKCPVDKLPLSRRKSS
jgi:hypothetical protein